MWLSTLDKLRSQYPVSDYADVRRQMYLETYRSLDRPREEGRAHDDVYVDSVHYDGAANQKLAQVIADGLNKEGWLR